MKAEAAAVLVLTLVLAIIGLTAASAAISNAFQQTIATFEKVLK